MAYDLPDHTPKQGNYVMAPATVGAFERRATRRERRRRIRLVILALLVVAYGIGVWYFSSHFGPGTTVNGVDTSMQTVDELAEGIRARMDGYQQHLTAPGGFDVTLTASDAGLAVDADAVAQEALQRCNQLLWLPHILNPRHMLIEEHVTIDEPVLTERINSLVESHNATAQTPTNASIAYNQDTGHYEVSAEAAGTKLKTDTVLAASLQGFQNLEEDVKVGDEALVAPTTTADDAELANTVNEANQLLDLSIDLQADGVTVDTIDHDELASWVIIGEDHSIQVDGIYTWLANNSPVLDAGNAIDDQYVWALDVEETANAIYEAVLSGSEEPVSIVRYVMEVKPQVTEGANERGRHIDVNLSSQFVRFYDSNGEVIWESYCVSGGYDTEFGDTHNTPTGTFYIENKTTDQTLVGADRDNDGEPDYESYVNYWIPFLNNDWGFHDATWRSEFGGDIRSWWGSHGCINLPLEKAAVFYDLVNVGDMVYIHE